MGWNIFYKECKYIAAHQMLKYLNKQKQKFASSTYEAESTDFNDIHPTPQWVELKEIKKALRFFPMEMLKDAAFMLHETSNNVFKQEADLLNSGKISEIKVKIMWDGETALKDRKYWRILLGSVKVFIPLIGATITGIVWLIRQII